ncbi:ATP-binding protein [Argonema antarcticum]|uniref:ATP-binding protein n=1 Tax=Argonema antarcticum TaxID=2942763 RepID=UPI0020125581|nr:ATP-binding protein [Argonema antarcticum]MCL1469607.1 PAS domain S-box protein [Argonema antarcticum A004/B2]
MSRETQTESWNGYRSEQNQPSLGGKHNLRSLMRLPRSLSYLETWGFGMTGHIGWFSTAPAMLAALGSSYIWVWMPCALVGMMLNLQVKRLGEYWPDIVGGTPNYTTKLLKKYPVLGRYAAIAYFFTWMAAPPVNGIVIAQLIKGNLETLGIYCPQTPLTIGFTAIGFIVALSGSRALGILHLCFIVPAIGFLLAFGVQGLGWLVFSADSPGFFPSSSPPLSFVDWAKWYFFATYAVYACETTSSFVAESKDSTKTLQFLKIAALLIPAVYVGNSWVLVRLTNSTSTSGDAFLNLVEASTPFWGQSASVFVTFLLVSGGLLSCATAVSNCPRILYQLAKDGHLSPTFAVVSPRGVFGPGLLFGLALSLICLIWGDIARIVVVTGTGYLVSIMTVHLGLWLNRGRSEVRWSWLSGGFLLVEASVLLVGGWAWGWQDVLIGALFPLLILGVDAAMRRIQFAPFHAAWWIKRYRQKPKNPIKDFVALQVFVLIFLVCSAVAIGWIFGLKLNAIANVNSNLLLVLIQVVAFIGVAIACYTSLPQVVAMDEAREAAEQLFVVAIDAIVVLDETGVIKQTNPAAESLFGVKTKLIGHHLNQLLPGLANQPEQWLSRSEQTLNQQGSTERILEVAISDRFSLNASQTNRDLQEYVVILRDITDRKQAQEALEKANEQLEIKVSERTSELTHTVEQLQVEIQERQRVEENLRAMQNQIIVQEKLASLGSLTAGIAHEIRNPLNFVNNFSELSNELLQELFEELENQTERLEPETSEYIVELFNDLKGNLQKINHHGQRADRIVSNMLLHSRGERGEWQSTNLNNLLSEYVNLAYHGMRAKEPAFNVTIETDYDDSIGEIEVVSQDMSRVFLNLINNACYSSHQKRLEIGSDFSPLLYVQTKNLGERVKIRIRDNGFGMTTEVLDKIFNPFFTTKPAGEGTGLGLSISHDIIVQQHRGEIKVETEVGSFAEFIILLPKKINSMGG